MVVDDLDVERITGPPTEAHTPLLIYADAVLARPVTFELLEAVARRNSQIVDNGRCIEHPEFPKRNALDPRPKPPDGFAPEQALSVSVLEALDHAE
jgi:hypothetical protein